MAEESVGVTELIKESGFPVIGYFDPTDLKVRPEVRDMCAADRCKSYGKSWSCPPGCGSLEEYQERLTRYTKGYLFQTVAEMEDPFDFEGIEKGGAEHRQRINTLSEKISASGQDIMLLGAGACSICETCTYPDAPCRFPERVFPSMEATGLVVYDVCALT
ncbi:MAG: DUF2284 domain-containing protein, partial [Coriobacteriales bacterium]|nr:DUF2284 domain-containing protein [Coriobacteriales bacterium]